MKFSCWAFVLALLVNGARSYEYIESLSCQFDNKVCDNWKVDNAVVQFAHSISQTAGKLEGPDSLNLIKKDYALLSLNKNAQTMTLTGQTLPIDQSQLIEKHGYCFDIELFALSGGMRWMNISILTESNQSIQREQVWMRSDFLIDTWTHFNLNVKPDSKRLAGIEIETNLNQLAVNHIQLIDKECHKHLRCTFEENEKNRCLLRPIVEPIDPNQYAFRIVKAAQFPLISQDHTTGSASGQFLTVTAGRQSNASIWEGKHSDAELSTYADGPGTYCVSFWAWKADETQDVLRIYSRPASKKSKELVKNTFWSSDELPVTFNQWSYVRRTHGWKKPIQFYLGVNQRRVDWGNTYRTFPRAPALDDFKISRGKCEADDPISCRFRNSLCGWKVNKFVGGHFILGNGRLRKSDHFEQAAQLQSNLHSKLFLYSDVSTSNSLASITSSFSPAIKSFACLQLVYRITSIPCNRSMSFDKKPPANLDNDGGFRVLMIREHKRLDIGRFTKSIDNKDQWSIANITLVSNRPFQLIIQAVTGGWAQSITSIDQIRFNPNEKCENLNDLEDLRLKSIEISRLRCSFDRDFCEWLSTGDQSLVHSRYRWTSYFLPIQDAGDNNLDGGFVFAHASGTKMSQAKHPRLESPQIGFERKDGTLGQPLAFCFMFSYYMHSTSSSTYIEVRVNNRVIYQTFFSTFKRHWRHRQVSFTQDGLFNIVVEGHVHAGDIAFDELKLYYGLCEHVPLSSIQCDFELGTCGWYAAYTFDDGHASFAQVTASKLSESGRIATDRTLRNGFGHVMALDLRSKRPLTGRSRLLYQLRQSEYDEMVYERDTNQMCLRFWYNLNAKASLHLIISKGQESQDTFEDDQDPNELRIKGVVQSWTSSAGHNSWYPERVQIDMSGDFKDLLEFHATYEAQTDGFVALDDMKLSFHKCPPIDCSFENSHCLWHFPYIPFISYYVKEGNLESVPRLQALEYSSPSQGIGPATDHTLANQNGLYLAAELQVPVLLRSQRIQIDPDRLSMCVKLWTAVTNTKDPVKLQLLIGYDSQTELYEQHRLQLEPSIDWVQVQLPFEVQSQEQAQHRHLVLYLMASPPNDENSKAKVNGQRIIGSNEPVARFAMDDLELNFEKCDAIEPWFNCDGNATRIASSQKCNFIRNCADGTDEQDCADCSFKDSLCGYRTLTDSAMYRLHWELDRNRNLNSRLKALAGDGQAITLRMFGRSMNDQVGALESSILHDSASECEVSFDFAQEEGHLELWIVPDHGDPFVIWHFKGEQIDKVARGKVKVGRIRGVFRLRFTFTFNSMNESQSLLRSVQTMNCGLLPAQKQCSTDQFRCANQACVANNRLCDHVDDCGDRSDEHDCAYDIYGTDFESGSGHLIVLPEIHSGLSTLLLGPGRDHSRNRKDGHFALLHGAQQVNGTYLFMSIEGIKIANTDNCYVRFYYMSNANHLSYTTRDPNSGQTTGRMISLENDFSWHRREVKIEQESIDYPIEFYIKAYVEQPNEFVAIDSISLTPNCYNDRPIQLNCQVDTPPEMCRWQLKHRSSDIFYRLQNEDWGDFNGPAAGEYLLIKRSIDGHGDPSLPAKSNEPMRTDADEKAKTPEVNEPDANEEEPLYDNHDSDDYSSEEEDEQFFTNNLLAHSIVIQSKQIDSNEWGDLKAFYFSFRYNMIGSQPGTISLKLNLEESETTELIRISGSSNANWQSKCIRVTDDLLVGHRKFHLQFDVQIDSTQAFAAIDQINFDLERSCFDRQLCTFDSLAPCPYLLYDLNLKSRTVRADSLKALDHTFGTGFGQVLHLKPREATETHLIRFRPINHNRDQCIRFWMLTRPSPNEKDDSFENEADVIGRESGETNYDPDRYVFRIQVESHPTPLFRVSSDFSAFGWRHVQIPVKQLQDEQLRIDVKKDEMVLIDDLSITLGSCQPLNCDFEKDSCGWIGSAIAKRPHWFHFSPKHFNFGPRVDHSEGNRNGKFMYAMFESNGLYDEMQLNSPAMYLRWGQGAHCLQFAYWIHPMSRARLAVSISNAFQQSSLTTFEQRTQDWVIERVSIEALRSESIQFVSFVAIYNRSSESQEMRPEHGIGLDSIQMFDVSCERIERDERLAAAFAETENEAVDEEDEEEKEDNLNDDDRKVTPKIEHEQQQEKKEEVVTAQTVVVDDDDSVESNKLKPSEIDLIVTTNRPTTTEVFIQGVEDMVLIPQLLDEDKDDDAFELPATNENDFESSNVKDNFRIGSEPTQSSPITFKQDLTHDSNGSGSLWQIMIGLSILFIVFVALVAYQKRTEIRNRLLKDRNDDDQQTIIQHITPSDQITFEETDNL